MEIRRIADPETGGHYTMYSETDFEYVNPLEYYERSFKTLSIEEDKGFFLLTKPNLPISVLKFIAQSRAEKKWKEQNEEIMRTEIPEQMISILTSQSKKEQEGLLKGLKFNPDQLLAFIFKAWTDYGFSYSKYRADFHQKGINDSDLPSLISTENNEIVKIGETPLTDGQLRQAVDHRRVTISKFLDKGDNWHCFFTTYKSLRGEESWNDGQPHYHYISDKFGMTRERVLTQLKSRDYNLNSLPHIELLDYGSGQKRSSK